MTTNKTNLFYSLNMLLNEQTAIDNLKIYLKDGVYPANVEDSARQKRYKNKFSPLNLKVIEKKRCKDHPSE